MIINQGMIDGLFLEAAKLRVKAKFVPPEESARLAKNAKFLERVAEAIKDYIPEAKPS